MSDEEEDDRQDGGYDDEDFVHNFEEDDRALTPEDEEQKLPDHIAQLMFEEDEEVILFAFPLSLILLYIFLLC